ncbi:MAG: hypothetical protein RLZZ301_1197 [Bacteroidota bacterium]|jgi:cytidine deaminase
MKKTIQFSYEHLASDQALSESDQQLVRSAYLALENAYAPYSQFKVGASVLLSDGRVVLGNNQENRAYPSGLCAERVALFHAGALYPDLSVEAICIVAAGNLLASESIISPCGSCRQVMIETEKRQKAPMRVLLVHAQNGILCISSAADLLPFAF